MGYFFFSVEFHFTFKVAIHGLGYMHWTLGVFLSLIPKTDYKAKFNPEFKPSACFSFFIWKKIV